MKKIIMIITVFGLMFIELSAQEAVVSGGGYHLSESISISWTMGELVSETLITGNFILTQGFQQSILTVVSVQEMDGVAFEIDAYPNPTKDFLYINIKNPLFGSVTYGLYDLSGRLLSGEKIESQIHEFSFTAYESGVYFLIISIENQLVKTFKIVKQ
jgi:hypothetical protein